LEEISKPNGNWGCFDKNGENVPPPSLDWVTELEPVTPEPQKGNPNPSYLD